jgi:hypothetical protein
MENAPWSLRAPRDWARDLARGRSARLLSNERCS